MYFLADIWSPIRLHMGKQVYSGRLQCGDVTQTLLNALVFRAWRVPMSLFYTSLGVKPEFLKGLYFEI